MRWRDFRYFFGAIWLCLPLMAQPQNGPVESPAQSAPWATATKPIEVIPFELYHNRVYVPVSVNGSRPYTMILDTGAAETFIAGAVAGELS